MSLPIEQILRFGVVGVLATLLHFGLLTGGVEWAGVPPVWMNGIAFCIVVWVTYIGQSTWVFQNRRRNTAQLIRFASSALLGLFANMAIMAIAVKLLHLHYIVGFSIALVLVPTSTFILNKFWVFQR